MVSKLVILSRKCEQLLELPDQSSCAGKNWADVLPPHATKELMGHSTVGTTMKYYSQVDEGQRTRAAAVIDGLISIAHTKVTPRAKLPLETGGDDERTWG